MLQLQITALNSCENYAISLLFGIDLVIDNDTGLQDRKTNQKHRGAGSGKEKVT